MVRAEFKSSGTRLFCFPHSGAGASAYRDWERSLESARVCAVQYPGHETRYGEPLLRRMEPLVEGLAATLGARLEPPFALFGHSLGALVAFELARYLGRHGMPGPARLFVSACRAPHAPNPFPPIYCLPEDQFQEVIAQMGEEADAVLQDVELWSVFEPILRADFEISDTYAFSPGPLLDCPILALGGRDDPFVEREALEAWKEQTRGQFRLRLFPGGHLYHRMAAGPLLLQTIDEDLAEASGESEPPIR